MKTNILLIYTGGTIGMVKDTESNSLVPLDLNHLTKQVPELKGFDCKLGSYEFEVPIDSSNVNPEFWVKLVTVIQENYSKYDGFVILHGTDTMAHTASALSFMIQNIDKPIILTGSQLPIGTIRTDGKENLITAIEIAMGKNKNGAIVKEVCVCFENKLYRGNRISKNNAEYFNAFSSENYPPLAEIGIHIHYQFSALLKYNGKTVQFNTRLDNNVAILKVFPGFSKSYVESILSINGLKAVVMETYGAGNAPTDQWFIQLLEDATKRGIGIVNVTQCKSGFVNQGHYETSVKMLDLGVVSAQDMTFEAAIVKLMYLLGQELRGNDLIKAFEKPISGEMTIL